MRLLSVHCVLLQFCFQNDLFQVRGGVQSFWADFQVHVLAILSKNCVSNPLYRLGLIILQNL
jgi:hypothetical protein